MIIGFTDEEIKGGRRVPDSASSGERSNDSHNGVAERLGLIGISAAHRGLIDILAKMANADVEVLLTGPTGVGKERYAKFIHECSRRSQHEFIAINCGAIPDGLFENEMFGHTTGALTGAASRQDGLVAAAQDGTLFLDEVNSLSPLAQVKLLRLIQEREYRCLGDTRLRKADVRFLAATNENLLKAVREGRFREDLFFRLRVVHVEVPSLRERPEDIAPLLSNFIFRYADHYDLLPVRLTDTARDVLLKYDWPGNIRELENCVRSLTCQQFSRPVEADDLPLLTLDEKLPNRERKNLLCRPMKEAKREIVATFEREYLVAALLRAGGNIAQAARLSGKNRRDFFRLMRKYGINRQLEKKNGDGT